MSHGVPRSSGPIDRSEAARKRDLKKIQTYKNLVEQTRAKIDAEEYTAETLALTSNLLSQNPEYYTIWNNRRLVLRDVFSKELTISSDESAPTSGLNTAQQEILLLIQEDLAFLLPLLKNYPKCYWIWNHRAWLLKQASQYLPASSSKKLWDGELGLVTKMLSYDSRNFHGWSYRRAVIQALECFADPVVEENTDSKAASSQKDTITEHEFAYTTKMIKTNLSNFSAWHNRLQLIPRLLSERNADSTARRKLLDDEFDLIIQALYTDPYDQSLWFYYNYLMTSLAPNAPESCAVALDLSNQDRLGYLEVQLDILKDILDGAEDCKYIYQALLTYTVQYRKIESGVREVVTTDIASWLKELEKLDPLRRGRWQDLRAGLGL